MVLSRFAFKIKKGAGREKSHRERDFANFRIDGTCYCFISRHNDCWACQRSSLFGRVSRFLVCSARFCSGQNAERDLLDYSAFFTLCYVVVVGRFHSRHRFGQGVRLHRRLHRSEGAASESSAACLYSMLLQRWSQAESSRLLQTRNSAGSKTKYLNSEV